MARDDSQFAVERASPARNDIRKNATGAESEQGYRNREKGEVIEIHNRKYAGKRKFQQQRGK